MKTQKENRKPGTIALLITLLAGVGAVLSYSHQGLRFRKRLSGSASTNTYRVSQIDWLGV